MTAETTSCEPGGGKIGISAREIAHGTGLSLSSVYRALYGLQRLGLIVKIPMGASEQLRMPHPARARGSRPE